MAAAPKKDELKAPAAEKKAASGTSTPGDSSSEEDDDTSSEGSDDTQKRLENLSLTKDQIILLKNAFTAFDSEKKGCLGMDMIGTILELLGHAQTQAELEKIVKEVDADGSGELEFEEFCVLASKFLIEEEDDTLTDLLTSELKDVFRYYDKDGNGYITTADFKEILKEIEPDIAEKDLTGMINEIDVDDSGTIDFEEFQKALR